MSSIKKKNQQFIFVLLIPRWIQIKNPKKVKKILAKQAIPNSGNFQPTFLLSRARFSSLT